MVDKHPHYVGVALLSVFRGNFALAKVCQGGIIVRCLELRVFALRVFASLRFEMY